jgi:DNA-binding winged helix-turn-helix (wHTH) protein/Tfp pilus assembly protein PilF
MTDAASPDGILTFAGFSFDPARGELTRNGEIVALTGRLRAALAYLAQNNRRLVTKDELLAALWPGRIVDEANLSQAISNLRKALGPPGEGLILTEAGRGYRFTAPVERSGRAEPPDAPTREPPIPKRRPRRYAIAVALVLAALAVGATGWWWSTRPPPRAVRVVLADFQNATGDPEFDHMMGQALEADLAQSPALIVASKTQVGDTLALMGKPKDTPIATETAREICRRDNGGAVLAGMIGRLGARYLVTLGATDCVSGRTIDEETAEARDKAAVPGAIDQVARRARRRLGESAASVTRYGVPLMPERTASFDALRAYSEGLWLHDHGRIPEAVAQFERATELDPNFAMAYTNLSTSYFNLREPDKDTAAITRAYALRNLVSEPRKLYISERYQQSVEKDVEASIRILREWIDIYPNDSKAWVNLSNQEVWLGRYDQAIADARRGLALGEHSTAAYFAVVHALERAGRFDEARGWLRKAFAAGVDGGALRDQEIRIAYLTLGDAAARALVAKTVGRPWERDGVIALADIDLTEGRLRAAFADEDRADDLARQQGVTADSRAWRVSALALLGKDDEARVLLAQATPGFHPQDFLLAMAMVGDQGRAERELRALIAAHPHDTLLANQFGPQIRATALLRQGRPQAALDVLHPALAYWSRDFSTPWLMGTAKLAKGDAAGAADAFRLIVANRGVSIDPLQPLARLGLARAERLAGDVANSRRDYAAFLAAWRGADADLPLLTQARAEADAVSKER